MEFCKCAYLCGPHLDHCDRHAGHKGDCYCSPQMVCRVRCWWEKAALRKLLACLLLFTLCFSLTACPVPKIIRGGDQADQALAALLLTVSNTRRFLEVTEQLYAPGQPVHLISKETALQLNSSGSAVIDYAGKAFTVIKAATRGSVTTLTPMARADLLSYANAMQASLPESSAPGITSTAAAKLELILAPMRGTLSKLAQQLAKLKSGAGDAVFQISLTERQLEMFDQLEAAIRP